MGLRTPLYDRHLALGARMVDFGGWDMPLQYSGMREEHTAVRQRAGLFDVSHMGEVRIIGPGAEATVQRLVTNDVSRLSRMQSLYSVMCNDTGGIVDDVIVTHGHADNHFIVTVNASTRPTDVAWMEAHCGAQTTLNDVSDQLALIALQGPLAQTILQPLSDADLSALHPFHIAGHSVAGISDSMVNIVSRTGYTGEDGFELYIDSTRAGRLWDALLDAGRDHGLIPCGLGARDTLRLEAGLRLYGQDMDQSVDPFSAGLGWTVKLDKGDFVGAAALRRIREQGPPRTTVGLQLEPRSIARHGMAVLADGRRVGEVTSGTVSFSLGCSIATALVDRAAVAGRESLDVDIRGRVTPATVVRLPFYRRRTGPTQE
jgi:aminomethyltransferase